MSDEVNRVSTRDVAAAARVSATLVSWVAKGTATQHRIPEATQRRVRAAIEQLGYRPAGPTVVGCQVAQLSSERPAGFLPSATQQPNNLTTLLSSAGYRLVPVQSKADLAMATSEGLVGLVYGERDNRPSTIDNRPSTEDNRPSTVNNRPLTEDQDPAVRQKLPVTPPVETLSLDSRSNVNGLRSEVVRPVSEVAADVPGLSGVEGPAADAASVIPSGTNAAGTSLRQGYVGQASAATLTAEPETA